jgi:2,3-bisphosphoglycerate-independent phosphoglycerate mutase
VPFIIFSNDSNIKNIKLSSDGILASVAPTVLDLMQITKPVEMTNQSLVVKESLIK